jgi:hypothetical protein
MWSGVQPGLITKIMTVIVRQTGRWQGKGKARKISDEVAVAYSGIRLKEMRTTKHPILWKDNKSVTSSDSVVEIYKLFSG